MNVIRTTVIAFLILTAFSCNHKESKSVAEDASEVRKLPSDKSTGKKPDKTEKIESKPCKYIVTEILTSSPRYKQLTKGLNEAVVKNGGLNYGVRLEGSPNPKQDTVWNYSKNYDFTVYESYTDRQINTAHFSFNPNNKQLYEFDEVKDKLIQIEFDRNLLLKYKVLCK